MQRNAQLFNITQQREQQKEKVEKVERFTYCEEFDNTGNDDIQ